MAEALTVGQVEALFTRADGSYAFARWGRPIAPVVFGVEEDTLKIVKGALEAVVALAGHKMAETDPELGANLMVFFFRDWDELPEVPNLDRLVPDLVPLVAKLKAVDANQYRIFRFDADGGIKASFVFLRMDEALSAVSADVLALSQVVQTILLWSDTAFRDRSPLAVLEGRTILRPEIAGLIRAAYDPVMPVVARDPVHALRLQARLQAAQSQ
ncbi:hypothetical protein ABWH93_18590 [Seohaeicola saemankumensis]|jgi:hypothetical protein|uniref:hypothetical protein n=1 Tax=Seohaeicola TaxID=481178 RepID=UPI0007F4A8D9|nr:hypothetical protein [Paracoccaceae bacterium]OAN68799.1 hypothetical protein A8B83_17260 [Rhodobacteraceae bacterium EhC02]